MSDGNSVSWEAIQDCIGAKARAALESEVCDDPSDFLLLTHDDIDAIVHRGVIKRVHVALIYRKLNNWQSVADVVGDITDANKSALGNCWVHPSDMGAQIVVSAITLRAADMGVGDISDAVWNRLCEIVRRLCDVMPDAWKNFWHAARQANNGREIDSELLLKLENIAAKPLDLCHVDINTLRSILVDEKQPAKDGVCEAIFGTLDSWHGVQSAIWLSNEQWRSVKSRYHTPLDLARAMQACQVFFPNSFGKRLWQTVAVYTSPCVSPKVVLTELFVASGDRRYELAPTFKGLDVCLTCDRTTEMFINHRLVDDILGSAIPSSVSLRQALGSIGDLSRLRVVDFSKGYVCDLAPIVDNLDQMPNLRYIDITTHSLGFDSATLRAAKVIASRMHDVNGALVLRGSIDKMSRRLGDWSRENLPTLLHFIWMQPQWLGPLWKQRVGQLFPAFAIASIQAAHSVFYEKYGAQICEKLLACPDRK